MPQINRTFIGTVAAEAFAGGSGFDTVTYAGATGPVSVNLGKPSLSTGFAAGDTFASIEAIVGSTFGDSLIGDNNRNVLNGIEGDDFLFGLGGDDVLIGGAGADLLAGGRGVDLASYETSGRVVASLVNPSVNTGDAAGDRYFSIEGFVGGAGNDDLTGNGRDNILLGGKGADFLYGLGGDDILRGGKGDDVLFGGAGADMLRGGAGFDTASYEYETGFVTVNLGKSSLNDGKAKGDSYGSIENVIGSVYGDALIGDENRNVLNGIEGRDFLFGLGGDDVLIGGAGSDILVGGKGFDLASYETSGGVTASLQSASLNTGDAKGDRYELIEGLVGGKGDDDLTGNRGDNLLLGGEGSDLLSGLGGNDILNGGADDDRLQGGAGHDKLTGGLGNDSFVFLKSDLTGGTADVITDLDTDPAGSIDTIQLFGVKASDVTLSQTGADVLLTIALDGHDATILIKDVMTGELSRSILFG